MVRRNKSKTRKNETFILTTKAESTLNESDDPWAAIENGEEVVAAREVFYKKASPKEVRFRRCEKKKKKTISDGLNVEYVEVHSRVPRGTKRTIGGESAINRMPLKKLKKGSHNKVNIFAEVIETKRSANLTEKNKRKRSYSPDIAETDGNDENLDAFESENSYDFDRCENYNVSLNGVSDDEEHIQSDEEQSDSDEEIAGEEVDVEDEDDESISDESDEDEGVLDDSTSLLDDEESDEEANLGEYREATVFQYTDGDATLYPPDFDVFPFTDGDSSVTATRAFAWMVAPCDAQTFFRDFFQSNVLVLKRNAPNYYGNLFSTESFVELVQNNYLEYGTNINIAEYKDGVRFTINGIGRVYPSHLRGHIAVGRSVQFVNPQTFDDRVWYFCEVLQELFGCFIGANTYLTPAGSSGFAPHWDDIDAFLLQLEGRKYWKVYAPDSVSDELPRESSGNFTDGDLKNRKPTFEGWIDAGDLLYIPRGFIHQATTSDDVHSLHITISSGRHCSFADLMDILVPEAITTLAKNRWKMRKSLPVGMLDMGGVADIDYRLDEHFEKKWKAVLDRHITALRSFLKKLRDGGIDIMAGEFMKTALPPMLTAEEKTLSVVGSQPDILHGKLMEFRPSTRVKLIRRHAQRLVFENENDCCIVHRMANSRVYEGRPQQSFSLPNEFIDGFNALSVNYPEWMSLSEMPSDMTREQVKGLCHLLYNHGLIMVQQLPDRVKKNVRRRK